MSDKLRTLIRDEIEKTTKSFTGGNLDFKAISSPTIKVICEYSLDRVLPGVIITDRNQDKFEVIGGYTVGQHVCLELYPVPKDF